MRTPVVESARQPVREPVAGEPVSARRISFFVAGTPRSMQTGSTRRVPKGKDASGVMQFQTMPERRNATWGAIVGECARKFAPAKPWEGPIRFTLLAFFPKAKSGKGAKRKFPAKRPDATNVVKGLEDVCNGVFFVDDSQIVDLIVLKRYSPSGSVGVQFTIEEIT